MAIGYLKQTDKPQIHYLKSRVDSNNLFIDAKYIEQRKQIMQKQIEAVIKYAEANKCRSRMLLEYFDENTAENCGVCDVCIDEKRKAEQATVFERITFEILELLSDKHLLLDELITSIHSGNEKERVEGLQLLLDAGKIKTDGAKYYI